MPYFWGSGSNQCRILRRWFGCLLLVKIKPNKKYLFYLYNLQILTHYICLIHKKHYLYIYDLKSNLIQNSLWKICFWPFFSSLLFVLSWRASLVVSQPSLQTSNLVLGAHSHVGALVYTYPSHHCCHSSIIGIVVFRFFQS